MHIYSDLTSYYPCLQGAGDRARGCQMLCTVSCRQSQIAPVNSQKRGWIPDDEVQSSSCVWPPPSQLLAGLLAAPLVPTRLLSMLPGARGSPRKDGHTSLQRLLNRQSRKRVGPGIWTSVVQQYCKYPGFFFVLCVCVVQRIKLGVFHGCHLVSLRQGLPLARGFPTRLG